MGYKLTTVAACRVARIDRQRFNEFVSGGDYPCAPETTPGRARLFEENDLIPLFIFGREIERGMKPLIAGTLADRVRGTLNDRPNADTAVIAGALNGPHFISVQPDTSITAGSSSGRTLLSLTTYNLAAVREIVRQGVEEERQIIGPEDDE